jgi:iron complex outermembrane recepter protein
MNAFKTTLHLAAVAAVLALSGPEARAQTAATNAPKGAEASRAGEEAIAEIIVTARRTEENAQTVPVSITAVDAATMATLGITTTNDLQKLVPGVILNGAGSYSNTAYAIRGQSKAVAGQGQPSVVTYFNEVPLLAIGGFTPTFDMDNVQILKGPQGTLFGRNTIGGAVLVYSKTPTYKEEGYIQADIGNFNKHSFQGAINIPIISNRLAVRIAGDIERQDGYTNDYTTGQKLNDSHSDALRASILFEPTDFIRNVTIVDYLHTDTNGPGFYPFSIVDPQLVPLVAAGDAHGPRSVGSTIPPYDREILSGASNTTTVSFGNTTFRNIFGYRHIKVHDAFSAAGLPTAPLPNLGPGLNALGYVPGEPGTLITTDNLSDSSQTSDEVQFSGKLLKDKLSWLLGGFYVNEYTVGPDYLILDLFRPTPPTPTTAFIVNNFLGGIWPVSQLADTLYGDASRALFANVSYDLSPLIDRLKLNAGYRYTWDRESVCSNGRTSILLATGTSVAAPYSSVAQCAADTGSGYGGASFFSSAPFHAPTYTIGLDYTLSDDIFLYFTTRRGYRAGGLNTPTLAPALAPFQTFKPVTVTDYEIGAHTKWRAGDWQGRFNIAAFLANFNSLQLQATGITAGSGIPGLTSANAPSNSTLTVNGGGAQTAGVEIDGAVSPLRGLDFTFGGSYLNARYTSLVVPALLQPFFSASHFTGAPRFSFQGGLQYNVPLDNDIGTVTFGADVYYLAEQYQTQPLLPSYSLTSARLTWSDIYHKSVDATLYVDNLFDKQYVPDVILGTPAFGVQTGAFGPPRMFGVRLRYSF